MKVFNSIVTIAVNEGLIRTEDINKTINILSKSYPSSRIYNGGDDEHIEIIIPAENLDRSKIVDLLTLINNLGWYPSAYYYNLPRPKKFEHDEFFKELGEFNANLTLKIERKYDQEYKKQNIFYHATRLKLDDKIKKQGLVPKSNSKIGYHPERIYLAKSLSAALDILGMLYDYNPSDPYWVIYRVDVSNIPNFKTMIDPNFDGGVYTLQNIPPSALTILKKFDMSK